MFIIYCHRNFTCLTITFHVLLLFQKSVMKYDFSMLMFLSLQKFMQLPCYCSCLELRCIVREENRLETVNIKFKKLSLTFNMKSNGIFILIAEWICSGWLGSYSGPIPGTEHKSCVCPAPRLQFWLIMETRQLSEARTELCRNCQCWVQGICSPECNSSNKSQH